MRAGCGPSALCDHYYHYYTTTGRPIECGESRVPQTCCSSLASAPAHTHRTDRISVLCARTQSPTRKPRTQLQCRNCTANTAHNAPPALSCGQTHTTPPFNCGGSNSKVSKRASNLFDSPPLVPRQPAPMFARGGASGSPLEQQQSGPCLCWPSFSSLLEPLERAAIQAPARQTTSTECLFVSSLSLAGWLLFVWAPSQTTSAWPDK